ncbi:hypothetical protein ACF1E9_24620 [Streptomyces roseolus]|uniref:hypothetical protein n=1 Tax=Streptomyces TaxID=1883 RepID=UPI0036EE0018
MAVPRLTPVRRRAALAVSGWVALAATALPDGSALRWIPVLAFVGFAPGLVLLTRQPSGPLPGARLEVFALAAPVSLALATLTATGLFLADAFSVVAFLGTLAAFVTVAALLPGFRLRERGGGEEG